MVFEVKKDGNVKMFTREIACIPTREEIVSLKLAGYKITKKDDSEVKRYGQETIC